MHDFSVQRPKRQGGGSIIIRVGSIITSYCCCRHVRDTSRHDMLRQGGVSWRWPDH